MALAGESAHYLSLRYMTDEENELQETHRLRHERDRLQQELHLLQDRKQIEEAAAAFQQLLPQKPHDILEVGPNYANAMFEQNNNPNYNWVFHNYNDKESLGIAVITILTHCCSGFPLLISTSVLTAWFALDTHVKQQCTTLEWLTRYQAWLGIGLLLLAFLYLIVLEICCDRHNKRCLGGRRYIVYLASSMPQFSWAIISFVYNCYLIHRFAATSPDGAAEPTSCFSRHTRMVPVAISTAVFSWLFAFANFASGCWFLSFQRRSDYPIEVIHGETNTRAWDQQLRQWHNDELLPVFTIISPPDGSGAAFVLRLLRLATGGGLPSGMRVNVADDETEYDYKAFTAAAVKVRSATKVPLTPNEVRIEMASGVSSVSAKAISNGRGITLDSLGHDVLATVLSFLLSDLRALSTFALVNKSWAALLRSDRMLSSVWHAVSDVGDDRPDARREENVNIARLLQIATPDSKETKQAHAGQHRSRFDKPVVESRRALWRLLARLLRARTSHATYTRLPNVSIFSGTTRWKIELLQPTITPHVMRRILKPRYNTDEEEAVRLPVLVWDLRLFFPSFLRAREATTKQSIIIDREFVSFEALFKDFLAEWTAERARNTELAPIVVWFTHRDEFERMLSGDSGNGQRKTASATAVHIAGLDQNLDEKKEKDSSRGVHAQCQREPDGQGRRDFYEQFPEFAKAEAARLASRQPSNNSDEKKHFTYPFGWEASASEYRRSVDVATSEAANSKHIAKLLDLQASRSPQFPFLAWSPTGAASPRIDDGELSEADRAINFLRSQIIERFNFGYVNARGEQERAVKYRRICAPAIWVSHGAVFDSIPNKPVAHVQQQAPLNAAEPLAAPSAPTLGDGSWDGPQRAVALKQALNAVVDIFLHNSLERAGL